MTDISKVKTLNDEYLIRIHEAPKKVGLIYVIRAEYEKTFCGIVEVIPKDNPRKLKKGMVVLFDNYAGRPFSSENERLILLKSDDIIAIVEDD